MLLEFLDDASAGAGLVWLFDLEWGGQTYHLAERTVSTNFGPGGAALDYVSGLDFGGEVVDAIDYLADDPELKSASITLTLGGVVNVPERIEQGHSLGGARGRLWIWAFGTSNRMLAIDGEIVNPEYGAAEEPLSLSVREAPWDDRGTIPGDGERVIFGTTGDTGHTWPNTGTHSPSGEPAWREDLESTWYPTIIGRPGGDTVWAAPVLALRKDQFLVAGHHVAASKCEVMSDEDTARFEFDIENGSDEAGNPIATIDPTSPISGPGWTGTEYLDESFFSRWHSGAGLENPFSDNEFRGAGDVIRWVLQKTTLRYDTGRIAAIAPLLNGFLIDAVIAPGSDRRVAPWAWVGEQLLPILPVSMRVGVDGLYLVPWRLDVGDDDVVLHLEEGRNADRDGAVSYDGTDIVANHISVAYGLSYSDDRPMATVLHTGDEDARKAAPFGVGSYAARLSFERYGRRSLEVTATAVHDQTTALRIAAWLAASRSAPTRIIEYLIPARLASLEPGDVVSLTDRDLWLSKRIAHVDSISWRADGRVGVALRIFESVPHLRS